MIAIHGVIFSLYLWNPLPLKLCDNWADKWGVYSKVVPGFRNAGEIFEGGFADMCGETFPLLLMGGPATLASVSRR